MSTVFTYASLSIMLIIKSNFIEGSRVARTKCWHCMFLKSHGYVTSVHTFIGSDYMYMSRLSNKEEEAVACDQARDRRSRTLRPKGSSSSHVWQQKLDIFTSCLWRQYQLKLSKWFLCLNQTRPEAQRCHSIRLKTEHKKT